jgi:hypothetical protein
VGQRNDALEALITEADKTVGCSAAGLARRVNELAAHEGIRLHYDYSAVYRWVRRGSAPAPPRRCSSPTPSARKSAGT